MRKLIIFVVLVAVLGGVGYWYWKSSAAPRTNFRTAPAFRGKLVATIGATGTLQPEEVVDVGAQVAGRVEFLGQDPTDKNKTINWGSAVEKGTLLAQIDPSVYDAQVASTGADLEKTLADSDQKKAVFEQAAADWDRAQKLKPGQGISQAEFDAAKAGNLVSEANVKLSKAQVKTAEANLKLAKTNLEYTRIVSPVKGVIIDRRVNVGQTVVASLSAPSLFLIAKDLSKMEIWATVNEVDVGKITIGQKVKFTVDAYPGRAFKGEVKAQGKFPARLNASMTQNVVTYTVVVSADNKDGTLWPYLTTNLAFIVKEEDDALLVPNAALRWQPSRSQIDPSARDAYAKMKGKKKSPVESEAADQGVVWVKTDDGFVRPIQVSIGLSDTVTTEILGVLSGGELVENTELVTGEGRSQVESGGSNPFVPAMPFGGKKKDQQQ